APDGVVQASLARLAAAHGDLLRVDFDNQIVLRKDAPVKGKVALVSGGGSGHEPLHGGFVGRGMLDAACPGEVFTSPVPDQMLAATKAVDGGAGVLHIVKNYTGDVMNFKLAAELAEDEGIGVESVLTNDDVAVEDSLYTAGRRGTGVTVLVEKIAGAKAEAGASPAEVAAVARRVTERVRAFVNGLGGTPAIELYLVYAELAKQLARHGVTASRSLVGNYITSLEMAGVSITLLELDDELTALWDAPVHTPALRWGT